MMLSLLDELEGSVVMLAVLLMAIVRYLVLGQWWGKF
jgi:hypothetical protein